MNDIPRVVIAAPASGSGKTTIATGLIAALRIRGHRIAPFKVGPDYIDPGYHALAANRPGRNLDPVLVGEERIAPLFAHGATGADVAIIEGVMGLFDGRSPAPTAGRRRTGGSGAGSDSDWPGSTRLGSAESGGAGFGGTGFGSTAHVARLLDAPVVLVVDSRGQGRSLAALLHGFRGYEPSVRLAAVVLNQVGSSRHEEVLREACDEIGLPVLGAVRRGAEVSLPSRHLGLIPAAEHGEAAQRAVRAMAELIAASIDLDGVCRLAASAGRLPGHAWDPHTEVRRAVNAGLVGTDTPGPDAVGTGALGAAIVGTGPVETSALGASTGRTGSGETGAAETGGAGASSAGASAGGTGTASGGLVAAGAVAADSAARANASPKSTAPANPAPASTAPTNPATGKRGGGPVVAIAGGPAFTFGYAEHAELLAAAGAEVVVFDPLRDEVLPEGLGALILPGGFPEQHASSLSANARMLSEVSRFARSGGLVQGECGGLLLLLDELSGEPMCGVIPGKAELAPHLVLGYRDAVVATDSAAHRVGERRTGHEFHRTHVINTETHTEPAWFWRDHGGRAVREGFVYQGVHASYLHTHPAGQPETVVRLVLAAGVAGKGAKA